MIVGAELLASLGAAERHRGACARVHGAAVRAGCSTGSPSACSAVPPTDPDVSPCYPPEASGFGSTWRRTRRSGPGATTRSTSWSTASIRIADGHVRKSFVTVDLPSAASNLAEFRAAEVGCASTISPKVCRRSACCAAFRLDEVRIDRISIDTITTHPHDQPSSRSIIALTREIGLEVTADGVETGAQADVDRTRCSPAGPSVRSRCLRWLRELPVASPRRAVRAAADTRPTWNTHELTWSSLGHLRWP